MNSLNAMDRFHVVFSCDHDDCPILQATVFPKLNEMMDNLQVRGICGDEDTNYFFPDRLPMALETKFLVSHHPMQVSFTLTNVHAPTKHDKKASSKRTAVRNIASNFNRQKKVSITLTASTLFFPIFPS